jgi:cytoskeletal protein CcmA (bactofilin family)
VGNEPAPEVLKPQADEDSPAPEAATKTSAKPKEGKDSKEGKRPRHGTYRPSHKATFIGLAVVVAILALNTGVIVFVTKRQNGTNPFTSQGEVTISTADLEKLGVSRNAVGNLGTELVVGPDSKFSGKLTVAKDVDIAGQLRLNSKFSASEASLTKLDAGNTSLAQLNVNGDGTVSTLNLRRDLIVAGLTRLQGPVTLTQLLTVNNSVNITGNLAVGGTLSARSFQASSLISDTTLTIGGHVITRGSAPGVSGGSALGSNGTASISGNDTAGTVAANIGVGGGNGTLASVSFRNAYGGTPHVVVTAIGLGAGSVYVNRSANGFSIGVSNALSPGGYAFDYIVMQ